MRIVSAPRSLLEQKRVVDAQAPAGRWRQRIRASNRSAFSCGSFPEGRRPSADHALIPSVRLISSLAPHGDRDHSIDLNGVALPLLRACVQADGTLHCPARARGDGEAAL
jgi:hypothetical protein